MSFLSLPVALWDNEAPTGQVSCIEMSKSGARLVLGFYDGKVYICDANQDAMTPKLILCGHTAAVTGITEATFKNVHLFSEGPESAVITASEDGMLISWDFRDGRSLKKARPLPGKVTSFKTLRSERHIVACGQFPNLYIIDAINLNAVKIFPTLSSGFVLCGSLFLYTESSRTLGEGFLALSMSGVLECFSLRTNKKGAASGPPIRPKDLRCTNAVGLHVNPFTNATMLLVTESACEIYVLEGLEYLLEIPCQDPQGWAGGMFCRHAEVVLWLRNGTACHYELPADLGLPKEGPAQLYEVGKKLSEAELATVAAERKAREQDRRSGGQDATLLRRFCQFAPSDDSSSGPAGDTFISARQPQKYGMMRFDLENDALICADSSSMVHIWSTVRKLEQWQSSAASRPQLVLPRTSSSFTASWVGGGFGGSIAHGQQHGTLLKGLTCQLQISPTAVIFGYRTGALAYVPMDALLRTMLDPPQRGSNGVVAQAGHLASVTCLLHPFAHGSPVDSAVFVSGSSDCTVRVWNAHALHHTFTNQAGEIKSLFCPPASSPLLRRGCICSIALNHSLAIYSIDAKACLHLFSGCCSPIQEIRWRCTDDYVIVWCDDGTAYIWQLITGHLDRKATGQLALDILAQCDAVQEDEPVHKSEHGLDFRLIPINPVSGKLPVLILDIERLISSLSRRSVAKTKAVAKHLATTRGLLRQLLSVLLYNKANTSTTAIANAFAQLQLQCCTDTFSYGVCDERNGTYSFMLPMARVDSNALAMPQIGQQRWCLSSHMSTAHLLATTTLLHALHRTASDKSTERVWQAVMSNFADHAALKALPGYKHPALLQLALLWEHWQHDIQRVARAQLQSDLKNMGQVEREQIVKFATARLPSSVRDHGNDEKLGSAILLGVMAHVHRDALKLGHGTAKRVADALTDIVQNEIAATKHRAAAAEVLGKAYESFKQYCDLTDIFLILTELAASSASTTTASQSTVALHALKNLALSNIHQFVEAINTQMFIITGHFHGHNSMLKVLKIILKTHPEKLAPELSKVVDVVVRCFDPGTPKIRESCFKSAMGVFHEMRPVYPMMGLFEARLAIGCLDGLINIYDLKSATRWQAIPAHSSPITSIAFSHDGKMLASFSIHEKTVRVWHVVGSFFGMISSAPKCIGSFNVPDSIEALSARESLSLTLVWTNKKTVVLMAGDLEFKFSF